MRKSEKKRTERFEMRLSLDEITKLKNSAKKANITPSDFMRRLIAGECVYEYNIDIVQGIKDLTYEINRIGTNVNQIAHNNNMEVYTEDDRRKLFAYMQEIYELTAKMTESVYNPKKIKK